MRKNGFTLIELLAVIVILAIIALIATPIILGIINDAREESNERSVELYASAVRNAIAAYQLREGKEIVSGLYTTDTLPMEVEYEGDVECDTIDIYEDGGVYITDCKVNNLEVDYAYGTKQEKPIEPGKMSSVCNPISVATEGTYTAGDKYECDVDPNKEGYDQMFYVLTTVASGATSVNLIMDSNINISGEAVKSDDMEDKGLVSWVTKADYTSEEIGGTETDWGTSGNWNKGPITAMNYLVTATSSWTNLNQMTVSTFTDETGATYNMGKTYKTNARLAYYNEVSNYSESTNNAYLYDNLEYGYCWDDEDVVVSCDSDKVAQIHGVFVESIDHVTDVTGYLTLSVDSDSDAIVKRIYFEGTLTRIDVSTQAGVRPVITLEI